MTLVALTLCLLAFVTLVAAFLTASMWLAILCIVFAVVGACVLGWDVVAKRRKHRALRDALAAAGTMLAEGVVDTSDAEASDLTTQAVALIHEHPDVEFTHDDFVEYGLVPDAATEVSEDDSDGNSEEPAPLFSEGEVDFVAVPVDSGEVTVEVPAFAPASESFAPAQQLPLEEVLATGDPDLSVVENAEPVVEDVISPEVSTEDPDPEHKSAS